MNNSSATPDFVKCLRVLAGLYSEFKLTPQVIESYWIILADIDPDLLKAATLQIASAPDTNFFPRAAALRAAAFALVETASGAPNADDAWDEVMKAMGPYSIYKTPEFSDPLIQKALDGIGGWRTLCTSEENKISYTRDAFKKSFAAMLGRARTDVRMLPSVKAIAAKFARRAPALGAGPAVKALAKGEEG